MKKWICFLNNRPYDPIRSQMSGETRGAAVCRYIDDNYLIPIPKNGKRKPTPIMEKVLTELTEYR
jgi:hypothetical protein